MRRNFIFSILAAFSLLSLGCEQLSENNSDIGQPFTVNATYDSGNSKATVLDGGASVYWEAKDEIKVFCGQASGKLISTNVEDSPTATFTGFVSGEINPSAKHNLYGLYPYREDASFDDGVITTTIPEVQTAVAGSFDRNANIAVAISESTDLMFRNVCGGLRFTLTNPGIKRIVFESNGGEHIAGKFSAQFEDGVPVVTEIKNGSSKVTLEAEDGSAFETGVWYYMSFLPTTLTDGYTVIFITDTQSATLEVNKKQTVKRGTYGSILEIDNGLEWKELEQYDYVIATDFADWDNACFGKNGELIMLKDCSEEEGSGRAYMLLPSETNGLDEFYASFDENDIPEMVHINGMSVKVLSVQDGLADVLVNFGDSLNVLIDSLAVSFDEVRTRSFSENNGVRNACAILRLILGAFEEGSGTITFVISAASIPETGVAGVGGAIAGVETFIDGYNTLASAYSTLFAPATVSYRGNWSSVIVSAGEQIFENGLNRTIEACASKEQLEALNNLKIFKDLEVGKLKNANSILSIIGKGIDYIDNAFGETITERERALMKYDGFTVVTGEVVDIGTTWAILSGYAGPDPYSRSSDWECGIIIDGSDGAHQYFKAVDSGYFEHYFKNLKRGSTYTFRAYFLDKEHAFLFLGKPLTFKTEGYSLSRVSGFEQTNVKTGKFSYEGQTYKYQFECTIAVTLDAVNEHNGQVEDWGYIYKDPYGNISKISLNGHSSPCRDSHYVFYRNESSSTACLYGYVKYADEECLYDNPSYYPLAYKGGEGCPDDNHIHAIDLGLSVMWACCNVGASKPEEYGGQYAWGETEEKTSYDWDTYKYSTGSISYTKYNTLPFFGTVDNKTVLEPSDDVAQTKWGNSWRMPTIDEFDELYSNCDSEWTTLNGVYGMKFTSRRNGNSIFLPAAGNHFYDELLNVGSGGYYWSSSLNTDRPYGAHGMSFDSFHGVFTSLNYGRADGYSVRPVLE